MWSEMFDLFLTSFNETLLMVAISGVVGSLLGVPLGVLLHLTNRGGVLSHPLFNRSIGVVVNVDQPLNVPELLRQADQALYHAKERGRNRVELATLDLVLPGKDVASAQLAPRTAA